MGQWDLELDRSSTVALYRQLRDRIVELIEDGVVSAGEKLPASRELATELGLNRNTVTSAYDELVESGFVRSHVGQGTFVLERPPPPTPISWSFSRAGQASGERVRAAAAPSSHPDPIDFASLVPDEELFPVEPFREALDEVLARDGKKLLQYGPAAGHPPLRDYIAKRLESRGVRASAENVLIVNGSQQGLDLVCRSLLDPGDRVALESPTYTIILPLLAQYQARIDEIPMTEQGMDLDALSRLFEATRPRLVFTMPTFHNPTGITMGEAARRRLLDMSARVGVPIVEDDFDSELRFAGESVPPLKALDEHDGVLHIGTFSKGLFPGLRIGWIVAPKRVVEAMGRSKLIADYHSSLLLQEAVLRFCRLGLYDEHLEQLANIYGRKSRVLTAALSRHFPDSMSWTEPQGGYAFWITLPKGLSAEALLSESSQEGVVFTPGSHFFAQTEGKRFFRLSISRVPEERIEAGIRKLGDIIGRQLTKSTGEETHRARGQEPALHI